MGALERFELLKKGLENFKQIEALLEEYEIDLMNTEDMYNYLEKEKFTDSRLDFRMKEEDKKFYIINEYVLIEVNIGAEYVYSNYFSVLDREYKLKDLSDDEITNILDERHTEIYWTDSMGLNKVCRQIDNRLKEGKLIEDELKLIERRLELYCEFRKIYERYKDREFKEMHEFLNDEKLIIEDKEVIVKVRYKGVGVEVAKSSTTGCPLLMHSIDIYEEENKIYSGIYVDVLEEHLNAFKCVAQ